MIKPIIKVTATLCLALTFGSSLACTNVFIANNGFAATARTMDFEYNTGFGFALGLAGEQNTSSINMSAQEPPTKTWTNSYPFLGQSWRHTPVIVDGVNSEGVYAAYLYLPYFTKYPSYNPKDSRPALNVFSAANYVLGTSKSVADALKRLRGVQIINAAMAADPKKHPGIYGIFPLHLVIHDKTGDSAVIEWVNGKTIIHRDSGSVLTNAPTFKWQQSHAHQYDYVSITPTAAKFDGEKMLGTGFAGIPGDFSAPSRFARAFQIIKNMPKPTSELLAERDALTVLESEQVPPGSNPSPTLWKSVVDLKNSTYYLIRMYYFKNDDSKTLLAFPPNVAWSVEPVEKVSQQKQLPKGWVSAQLKKTPAGDVKKVLNFTKSEIANVLKQQSRQSTPTTP